MLYNRSNSYLCFLILHDRNSIYCIPLIEKIKASLNALLLLMICFLVLPLDSRFALQHAVKANFWACDNALFALEMPLSNTKSEIKELQKLFASNTDFDVAHLYTSLQYKKTKQSMNPKKCFVFKYTIKSIHFVLKLYFLKHHMTSYLS